MVMGTEKPGLITERFRDSGIESLPSVLGIASLSGKQSRPSNTTELPQSKRGLDHTDSSVIFGFIVSVKNRFFNSKRCGLEGHGECYGIPLVVSEHSTVPCHSSPRLTAQS